MAANKALVIAIAAHEQGVNADALADGLNLRATVIHEVEQLLYATRNTAPAAMLLSDQIVSSVTQLDIIALLKRRAHLAPMPLICFGPHNPDKQWQALNAGAELYLNEPLDMRVVKHHLRHFLEKRSADNAMRRSLQQLRKLEEQYKAADRVKDDLTHMLVHDLKSPIASVMGLLDHCIAILEDSVDAQIMELLRLARGESRHLLNLASNILDVRRMKEGQMPYEPVWIPKVSRLAKESLQDASGSAKERKFSFLVRPDAERLYADPNLLRRILANLFANAIKHTRRGGHVDFRAWRQDQEVMLSVRDDGEGIPEEDHARIFNAFEQSRHTIHDRYDSGMGLTFCKLAVEKHGGSIWVQSKVGMGSTFTLRIPDNANAGTDDALAFVKSG